MPLTNEQKAAREAWLSALESGDYPQTTGMLADENGYCCLGVACEVLGIRSRWKADTGYRVYGEDEKFSTLPPEAVDALGIGRYNPYLRVENPYLRVGRYAGMTLAALNDGEQLSLKEIAAEIRMQPGDWDGNP